MDENDGCGQYEVDNSLLQCYEWDIRDLLQKEQDSDGTDITLDLSNRTLVINEALKRGCEGRLNFTIAHEIAHHIIDVVCGANYSI